jgi:hypothetical protein
MGCYAGILNLVRYHTYHDEKTYTYLHAYVSLWYPTPSFPHSDKISSNVHFGSLNQLSHPVQKD